MKHLDHFKVEYGKINYQLEFENQSKDFMSVLAKMLEFNPFLRSSAGELIKSPFFDDIRDAEMEKLAPYKIKVPEGPFDYDTLTLKNSTNILDTLIKECDLT